MADNQELLGEINKELRAQFEKNKRLMSFGDFFDMLVEKPDRHARNAVQYLRDALLHYGETKRETVTGQLTRYALFDAPFDDGRERMIGQERAQQRVFQLFDNFVRGGKIDKLILLHGPNGSAKSTFVKVLMRALEHYSRQEDGALYRFNWVFPTEKISTSSGSIGFSDRVISKEELATFALLDEEQIDARMADNLHDHPLLLLPQAQRQKVLERALEKSGKADDFVISEYIRHGDLSHTNRLIFDTLLTTYKGDLEAVLKHVQVERFFISRRYRRGAVTIEPQMRVDAGVRQLTVDRSLQSLPPVLQNVTLFEPVGDLVDANRGIIEYDDLFKRHPDLNKYLLSASERGAVSLDNLILHMDTILIATGNETYLDAFKQTAEYASFKGRVELVRLPYLLDWHDEQVIYEEQVEKVDVGKFVAPHTTRMAALWAVLTRLKRPTPDAYPSSLRDVIAALTPLEKAMLYADGEVPEELSQEKARELKSHVSTMLEEGAQTLAYEGRQGASPREMKMILLNAAQNEKYPTLSPLAIFDELEELVKDPTVFPFLQMKPDGDYHCHGKFIDTVRERYLDLIDEEIQDAMGLVEEKQYENLFARYIDHVLQSVKNEKVYNNITGNYEDPDDKFMNEIEETMGFDEEAASDFRGNLISAIGASFIDNPDEQVEYKRIFPKQFSALKRSFYEERAKQIEKIQRQLLVYFEGEQSSLSSQELQAVEQTIGNLRERYGHNDDSAREAVAFLLANRYRDVE